MSKSEISERINIGIFVNSIQNDYTTLMCKGAAIAAEEYDVNLIIIPGREINATWNNIEINQYEYQNNILYSYIRENNLDVLLVSIGTVAFFMSRDNIEKFMGRYAGIKLIAMEAELENYPCIVFGLDGLKEAIEHIIKEHKFRKVAFISGPNNHIIANKRLDIYKKVLEENGIEYNPNYVVYGDFTEYCIGAVRELLDKNRKNVPEAICCANDSMVLAVYKVFKERNIIPGKDIMVTGYDDTDYANVSEPPITTVKSYIMSMGYEAVESAVKYYYSDEIPEIQYVKTSLVVRQSCGCCVKEDDFICDTENLSVEKVVDDIENYIFRKSSIDIIPENQLRIIDDFIKRFYNGMIEGRHIKYAEISTLIDNLLSHDRINYFNIDSLNAMMSALRKIILKKAVSEEHKLNIYKTFENAYKFISIHYAEQNLFLEKKMTADRFIFTRISDDMINNSKNEDNGFKRMLDDLRFTSIKACYLYTYKNAFLNSETNELTINTDLPDTIFLKGFYSYGKCIIPFNLEQEIRIADFLNNQFVQSDRRRTLIMQALYFNEEQYGMMLVEADINHLLDVPNVTRQICTAIKMTRSVNLLETALDEIKKTNEVLSIESISDQLTGTYNRRGFIIESEKVLTKHKNERCAGAVLFADLDNLKTINDTFGHKDGDFAIKKASEILKDNLRETDIVGRIGGDEFVAFIMNIEESEVDAIGKRIKQYAKDFNTVSDKPYNVDISVGIYCFDPKNNETIDQLMTKADRILYENKKHKNKTAIKSLLQ